MRLKLELSASKPVAMDFPVLGHLIITESIEASSSFAFAGPNAGRLGALCERNLTPAR
jgi:hypothetical protein